jgi:hypothetical protein
VFALSVRFVFLISKKKTKLIALCHQVKKTFFIWTNFT